MTTNLPTTHAPAINPVEKLKEAMNAPSVQQQFKNALAENAPLFTASLIDLYASDTYLQRCDPKLVIMECLKAATLKLHINKNLGFAYIVPYNKSVKIRDEKGKEKWEKVAIPQFQLGYKGYIQLAMRTSQYLRLNDGVIYEGQHVDFDAISGDIKLSGAKETDEPIGYFAYFKLINGFEKIVFMTKAQAEEHGRKFSKSYNEEKSTWKTNFDSMALKTCWRKLISKYGIMSIEMSDALRKDDDFETDAFNRLGSKTGANANQEPIDITPVSPEVPEGTTEDINANPEEKKDDEPPPPEMPGWATA